MLSAPLLRLPRLLLHCHLLVWVLFLTHGGFHLGLRLALRLSGPAQLLRVLGRRHRGPLLQICLGMTRSTVVCHPALMTHSVRGAVSSDFHGAVCASLLWTRATSNN